MLLSASKSSKLVGLVDALDAMDASDVVTGVVTDDAIHGLRACLLAAHRRAQRPGREIRVAA
jgi:hypothetical protein